MGTISVVIPTKDRLPYLQETLPAFLKQREVEEVVIVIDGCQDGTLDYVKSASANDHRIRYVDNVINKGLPYSRNRGIELASSDYVFTGEDDLTLSHEFFSTLLSHMEETGADIIAGRNIFQFDYESTAEAINRTGRLQGSVINKRRIAVHTGIMTASDQEQILLPAPMLARTDVFRKIRFDAGYAVNAFREESDFQLSALEAGYKLVYCPHAISFNLIIPNDNGGVHYSKGLKRFRYLVANNWRFIRKHRRIITAEFNIGNPYVYISAFAVRKFSSVVIRPTLGLIKIKGFKLLRISR
jgi:glycosyltransferase involved in cell wall biosynthesis